MLTPQPPRPSYPPPGSGPGESDESLAAGTRGGTDDEVARSTALLIARHWQPVQDYAVICLASAPAAAMVATAAFHQVLDRLKLGEPGAALRPRLLVGVRDTVRLWASDPVLSASVPDLGKPAGARGMRAAASPIPENRVLTERAFQALPPVARAVLWHAEVEADPITVPAGLLGMDLDAVAAVRDEAREKLRQGCVRAHRELAPSRDCGFYNRLLDVPIGRGGELLPDVRRHLDACRYCRAAAEQLGQFERDLGMLLAEAVLGWGARRYVDSRPGRAARPATRLKGSHRGGGPGGSRRRGARGAGALLDRIPSPRRRTPGAPRSPRALFTGVGLASAGLITAMLAAGVFSDEGSADPATSTAAADGAAPAGSGAPVTPTAPSDPDTAQLPVAPRETRLRNTAADLCLDVRGEAVDGAPLELRECSPDLTQQWSYERDGLMRNLAEPELCADSHADAGVVILAECAETGRARADDVRYDLSGQGEFVPRWDDSLALAATAQEPGADVVVQIRDRSAAQRWVADPTPASAGSLSITRTDGPPPAPGGPSGRTA
ncbi:MULTISPECIES: RICIN domain-containing protein [unclassified Streptomyces]|uniref:RICIN domain-containing protein n=1 Tax=unclassified Streptomyces TaxID=2593676 RepID=UPI00380DF2B1